MFLGVDIGTSGIKATITDIKGNVTAHAYRPLKAYGASEKKRELNPVEVEEKMFETMSEVLHAAADIRIELVTIASLGEAVVPVAKDGSVLMNSIVGSDSRGGEELRWLCQRIGIEELTDITGLNLSYIYSLNKILYIKKNFPRIHEQVWKYMCFTDYAGYLLTGETKIDYSMASRTLAFDIREKQWSRRILDEAEISAELFSKPVQGGTVIGTLSQKAKERFSLYYDIPVMAGSHDHIYNAIGAGVVLPGSCSNTVGTTEGITAVLDRTISTGDIKRSNVSCEPFVQPNVYNTVAWHNTAGAMVNWFTDTFYRDSAKSRGEILNELNKTVDSAPGSLMVLPHFSGSTARYMDEKAKGCILGLTTSTDRVDIYKAVLEGASYEFRVICDCIKDAGLDIDKVIISGGGSKSLPWLQVKANILGRTVYKALHADTGAVGGAVLGAVLIGQYASLAEAASEMIGSGTPIEPDMEYHKIYEERYAIYRELYMKLKDVNHLLS